MLGGKFFTNLCEWAMIKNASLSRRFFLFFNGLFSGFKLSLALGLPPKLNWKWKSDSY